MIVHLFMTNLQSIESLGLKPIHQDEHILMLPYIGKIIFHVGKTKPIKKINQLKFT